MTNTEIVTRKEIIRQAEKLATLIAQSAEVDFFKRAEQQIKKNDKVQQLIAEIKRLQKHAVHYEHYEKSKALEETEAKLEKLHEELDQIPVVQEFKQSQKDVNDLLQLVTNVISNTVTDKIIESTGGDVLKGETGGGPNLSCPLR
ncbi:cell fate (sporulation/competence/biofilm development) regulator YmcA (YheA/YmcA/DUF963 family) [Caldalkalibacillus uzonensis]|uniref:Cell fate (Sporulation/competence/biofilm development) regulator YmcA (YheA/YmcA/DUF963 family) n=1 Tax=Caldalkalibacillus uzonensis TaxID=353224 RepID=A0ABU0CMH1_9BACI|nr:YlbF family regulator [Caldalkalibacillus uzonensis]MDQ0337347.1 cell fate (sporulation/competence/biofilm development) regulator YmcA (YheA/YmcA/DUF963 family) [Caldalkalibacillus uzonensis]